MKRRRYELVGLAAIFILVISQVGEASAQEYKFRIGHVLDDKCATHMAFNAFAQAVEKDTKGRVKISVVPAGGLGSLPEMIEQLKLGVLEMMQYFPATMQMFEPKFMCDDLPYLWKDVDQAMNGFHGDLGKLYHDLSYKEGLKILAYAPIGFRNMTNNRRPIHKVDDLKGLKIRVAESKLRVDAFKLMGISTVPIPFAELYMAMELKMVDGQENPVSLIYSSKFYEVQKYLSLTNHIFTLGTLAFSRPVWEKLPKDIQDILQKDAVEVAEKVNLDQHKKDEAQGIRRLKEKGMVVNEVEADSFKKVLRPLYTKYAPTFGPELINAMKKYAGAEF